MTIKENGGLELKRPFTLSEGRREYLASFVARAYQFDFYGFCLAQQLQTFRWQPEILRYNWRW
ncbi:hypothetical protein [Klebsiella pneumoniae]|uniref:hypothetical protein n=1 Tax=Klebsiella pneumoniae TaxID=573 RepID=UPI0024BE323B|nr:hypothetical protein [Klebsiella pneumoniae]